MSDDLAFSLSGCGRRIGAHLEVDEILCLSVYNGVTTILLDSHRVQNPTVSSVHAAYDGIALI